MPQHVLYVAVTQRSQMSANMLEGQFRNASHVTQSTEVCAPLFFSLGLMAYIKLGSENLLSIYKFSK